jgi:methionyl-tRNA synthetase
MPENYAAFLSTHSWILVLAAIWTLPWKGVALWRAARNQSTTWFVVLLIVNTLGILEIVYIFAFSKKTEAPQPIESQETPISEKKVLDIKIDTKSDLDDQSPKS